MKFTVYLQHGFVGKTGLEKKKKNEEGEEETII